MMARSKQLQTTTRRLATMSILLLAACYPNDDNDKPSQTSSPTSPMPHDDNDAEKDDRETEAINEETVVMDLSELFAAIAANEDVKVTALVKARPEITAAKNSASPYAHTPLLEALDRVALPITVYFLKAGANPFTASNIC